MDTLTKEQRSYVMSRIRSKWTSPERKIHNMLKGMKVKHRMHPNLLGSPDIALTDSKTAIFIHGCFWHGCPKHYIPSKTRAAFWQKKIETNIGRDREASRRLRLAGWKVKIIWEHDIENNLQKSIVKIIS